LGFSFDNLELAVALLGGIASVSFRCGHAQQDSGAFTHEEDAMRSSIEFAGLSINSRHESLVEPGWNNLISNHLHSQPSSSTVSRSGSSCHPQGRV
jgi:hypothetical protein